MDRGFEVTDPQRIDPKDESGPDNGSDKLLGLLLPQSCHPRSSWIMESKVNLLEVSLLGPIVPNIWRNSDIAP